MTVIHGDSLDVLRGMEDNSIDAIVTDPPYGLTSQRPGGRSDATKGKVMGGFMGLKWDYDVPSVELWAECLRVLKPGGHLLAFAGTRTQHRMAVRIEDAGFEIRDMIMWVYGSGFPKSQDVSKALDRRAGAEREVVGERIKLGDKKAYPQNPTKGNEIFVTQQYQSPITAPATPEAQQWAGWGSALKPALEPITVARKPLTGTLAANVLQWGTGGLNIDACRVGTESVGWEGRGNNVFSFSGSGKEQPQYVVGGEARPVVGRWPANVVHDGSEEVVERFPVTGPAKASMRGVGLTDDQFKVYGKGNPDFDTLRGYNDAGGSAARFFYCAKASRRERDAGLDGMPLKRVAMLNAMGDDPPEDIDPVSARFTTNPARNHHATVKPIALMEWLIKLVTPPGGVVLDPFAGSGTTGCAAARLGVRSILIEREAEYVEIARRRVAYWSAQRSDADDLPLFRSVQE